jgi:WD40 repeat protein
MDIVFALVTVSGSLVVYSRHVAMKSIVKIAAHTGDSTCLDFHPTRPYIIATGGSTDRCVKGKSSQVAPRFDSFSV